MPMLAEVGILLLSVYGARDPAAYKLIEIANTLHKFLTRL